MKKVNDGLKAGDTFSQVGNTDKVKRSYTVIERTVAIINNGNDTVSNVVAHNHATGKKTVFAFSALVGQATLIA